MDDKLKKDHPRDVSDLGDKGLKKIQEHYVHNILKVEQVEVIRVLVKTPSNLYNPNFDNNLGFWEQYWDKEGKKIFERPISVNRFWLE